jgi:hypothetical protein
MFLFDWQKVYETADASPLLCCVIMEMIIKKQIPKNKYDRIYNYSQKDFKGDCFLLHPDVLMYHSYKYSHRDIAIYYALAACRPLADYIATQKTTLDVLHLPVDLDLISNNSLLSIEDGNVHFLYEEVTKKDIH